jgi:transposase
MVSRIFRRIFPCGCSFTASKSSGTQFQTETLQLILPLRQCDIDSYWGEGFISRNLFWLSNEQWSRIAPHLPTDVRGVERADDRRVISGIVHMLKSGCRWCDCPEAYGPPTTVYNRFVRWARRGIWENLFREHAGNGRSADTQMIDSTHVKAHRMGRPMAALIQVLMPVRPHGAPARCRASSAKRPRRLEGRAF